MSISNEVGRMGHMGSSDFSFAALTFRIRDRWEESQIRFTNYTERWTYPREQLGKMKGGYFLSYLQRESSQHVMLGKASIARMW
jgi:hypothetical protein